MRTRYFGCVTFSAHEGNATSIACGHSVSSERLENYLRSQVSADVKHVAGIYYLYIMAIENGEFKTVIDTIM